MPMPTNALARTAAAPDAHYPRREPRAIEGWPLARIVALDAGGDRGLLADLAIASDLRRQGAFSVLAAVRAGDQAEQVAAFLARLREVTTRPGAPTHTLGAALRAHRVRDLVAAAMEVIPAQVTRGFLKALAAIGDDPLNGPGDYLALWRVFAAPERDPRRRALAHLPVPITTGAIRAVLIVDPLFLDPLVFARVRHVVAARQLNALIAFVRDVCGTVTDDVIRDALRHPGTDGLDEVLRRLVATRADRLPTPPLASADDVVPMATAAELIALGKELRNCAADKVVEAALGHGVVYRITHTDVGGVEHVAAADLRPQSDGRWRVVQVRGPKNRALPAAVRRAVLARLHELGAVLNDRHREVTATPRLDRALGYWRHDGEFLDRDPDDDRDPDEVEEALDAEEALDVGLPEGALDIDAEVNEAFPGWFADDDEAAEEEECEVA